MSLEEAVARAQLVAACQAQGLRGPVTVRWTTIDPIVRAHVNNGFPFHLVKFDGRHLYSIFKTYFLKLHVD